MNQRPVPLTIASLRVGQRVRVVHNGMTKVEGRVLKITGSGINARITLRPSNSSTSTVMTALEMGLGIREGTKIVFFNQDARCYEYVRPRQRRVALPVTS
jgi:hypothetical protein